MNNTIYRLVAPKTIEAIEAVIESDSDHIIVKPTHLSICHADQRYYQGSRSPEVLKKKLPMALIHEGIGDVIDDPSGILKEGQKVVMIPNTPYEKDDIIAENYLRSSKFRASGSDGFMQDYISIRKDRVIPLPEGIDYNVAAFTEICSVSFHAIKRFIAFSHQRRDTIGVWGEGNLGYITSLLIKKMLPESKLVIFGVVEDKMKEFTFADGHFQVNEIPDSVHVDHAFECVGNAASGIAINQMIDQVINPEGTISIMGVSENPVPINTRMVLEKGLKIFGSSRSGSSDFEGLIKLYYDDPELIELLKIVIGDIIIVNKIEDMHNAFYKDIENGSRKTIMRWNV